MKRKHAKQVHTLADENSPCGVIRFTHTDGKEHFFSFARNAMSNAILSWWGSNAPEIHKNYTWIKSVIRDVYAKSNGVIEHIGDFQPNGAKR